MAQTAVNVGRTNFFGRGRVVWHAPCIKLVQVSNATYDRPSAPRWAGLRSIGRKPTPKTFNSYFFTNVRARQSRPHLQNSPPKYGGHRPPRETAQQRPKRTRLASSQGQPGSLFSLRRAGARQDRGHTNGWQLPHWHALRGTTPVLLAPTAIGPQCGKRYSWPPMFLAPALPRGQPGDLFTDPHPSQ